MGREERRDHIMDHEGLRGLIHSFTPYYYCTVIATVAVLTGLWDILHDGVFPGF